MPKGATYSDDVLKLVLDGTAIANVADNAGTAPLTNLYISLHTSSPGPAGNQSSNEVAYTSYARRAVARNPGSPAWTISGGVANPNADLDFPTSTGGAGGTITHFAVGTASSGTGKILYIGLVTPNFIITTGVTPVLDKDLTQISEA